MKCALVTGGSRGIGRAICIKLAGMGYYVLVNYKGNLEAANETLSQVKQNGSAGELLQFDVAKKEEVRDILGKWIEANSDKTIEVLINNAGIKADQFMILMTDEQWQDVLDTSLGGFYYVTKQVINSMWYKKYGRIINVVSLSGLKGLPGQVNYSAAKAAVIGATKALAQEVGHKGITVNAVAPGFIRTDMTEGLPEKDLVAMIPLKRFGTPEEVANTVGFLASPEASYITAEVISINGGLYS